jgi:hypothetical protein
MPVAHLYQNIGIAKLAETRDIVTAIGFYEWDEPPGVRAGQRERCVHG